MREHLQTLVKNFFMRLSGRVRGRDDDDFLPRRDWALLCGCFILLLGTIIGYSGILFANAESADTLEAQESAPVHLARTIDRNALEEALRSLHRLRATFDEAVVASSSSPRPE